jgi:CMP-N-acetylneuraminic acid synthetase
MDRLYGFIPIRNKSTRLVGKSELQINGIPLYERAIKTLEKAGVTDYSILTNVVTIFTDKVLRRPVRMDDDEFPMLSVVKWAIGELVNEFIEIAVVLMPAAPGITSDNIRDAIAMIKKKEASFVRSYSKYGQENGLYVFNVRRFMFNKNNFDSHTGAISARGIEIHNLDDYQLMKRKIEAGS